MTTKKIGMTQIGVMTPRDGLGNFIKEKTVKIFALTDDLRESELMPETDDDAHVDIAGLFVARYREYVEAGKAAKRENALRRANSPIFNADKTAKE